MGFPHGSDGKEATYSAGDPGQEDPLEKGMSTHSSILAWGIPWTEDPGGLQSMGSQRDTTKCLNKGLSSLFPTFTFPVTWKVRPQASEEGPGAQSVR